MASLFVIRGRDSGQHFELLSVSTTLGREATNQIQLHDTEVSRHHARLDRGSDGSWTLVDLSSSNGSFVNSHVSTIIICPAATAFNSVAR